MSKLQPFKTTSELGGECGRYTASGSCAAPATHVLIRRLTTWRGDVHGASEEACERHCNLSAVYLASRGTPYVVAQNPALKSI